MQVPNVVGKTRTEAEAAIDAAGLTAVVYEIFNTAQAGKVIAQLPAAASEIGRAHV